MDASSEAADQKPRLLLLVDMSKAHVDLLSQSCTVVARQIGEIGSLSPEDSRARIVWTNGGVGLSDRDMAALPALEIIVCQGVGHENIDLEAARSRLIRVVNGSGTNSATVADHALALLLSLLRQTPTYDRQIRDGQWTEIRRTRPILSGRRVGIVGLGNIGRLVAQRVSAFDCDVSYHSRRPVEGIPYRFEPSALALASHCDVIFLCCPGGQETHHLVDRTFLTALGPDGVLVNVSRGTVVDTDALIAALSAGSIAGAALDVVDGEPQVPPALIALPNLVMTPHVAGLSRAAVDRAVQQGIANIKAHFAREPLLTPV